MSIFEGMINLLILIGQYCCNILAAIWGSSFRIISLSLIGLFLLSVFAIINKRRKIREQIRCLAEGTLSMTPEEFMKMRNASLGGRGRAHISTKYNFAGIYILYNKTKNMYYVGQGQQVLNRVNNHFTGKGNGDVYADYKYGDCFEIKMIDIRNSGFSSLNELERNAISTYDSYAKGYNKTRGNRK